MANLSEIKKESNWGDAASTINSNFQNMNVDLEKVKSATTKFRGYFTSETVLKQKYPSPQVGDTAYVGEPYPGTVYDVQVAGTWHNTGTEPDAETVNLTEYAKKEGLIELSNAIQGISWMQGGILANGIFNEMNSAYEVTDFIPVYPGLELNADIKKTNESLFNTGYDENQRYVGTLPNSGSITIPEGIYYVRINLSLIHI